MSKFVLIYFLFISSIFANEESTILSRWNRSGVKNVEGTSASMQILERFILAGPKSYGIATVVLTKALRDPDSIATIITDIKRESGFEFKRTFNYQGTTFAEFNWKRGNRHIRYGISDIGDYRLISISSYRPGYAQISAPESAAIQIKWHHLEARAGRKTTLIILDTIFPQAHAQVSSIPGLDMTPILDSLGGGDDITTSNLAGGVTTFDQDLNVNVGGAVDFNVSGLSEPIDELGGIADRSIGSVDKITRDTLQQADQTTQMVDKNWSETNKQFHEANRIAAKMSDPKHAFLLAGATAAGAVIGSSVASLAVQGVVKGLDWLIEQITDAKGKEDRWRLFREAREKWEETMDNARNLEASIDQFLLFNDVLKTIKERLPPSERDKLTIENVIAQFGRDILLKQKRRKELYEKFMASKNATCEAELAIEIQKMDGLITNMGQVMGHLQDHKKNNDSVNIFDERFFCDQLGDMLRNLVDAESALQRYRMLMISGQTEWREQALGDFEDLRGRTNDFNDRQDGDFQSREKDQIVDRLEANIAGMKKQFKQICSATEEGASSKCYEDKWNSPQAQAQRKRWEEAKESELNSLEERTSYRSKNPLGLNTDVEAQRLERYREWFQELEDQQFCAQNPDDERCLELNQFRFNGVFYNKERAFERLNQSCPDRQLSLPSITAKKVDEARIAAQTKALNEGRSPASANKSEGFLSSIGNFFKGLLDSIANFFGFGNKKATIGETRFQDSAIPEADIARTIVDDGRTPQSHLRNDASKTSVQISADYVTDLSQGKSAQELVEELEVSHIAADLEPEYAGLVREHFTKRIEALGSENANPVELEKILKQISGLKEKDEYERARILRALFYPEILPPAFNQAFQQSWLEGTAPTYMIEYLDLISPKIGLGLKWPDSAEQIKGELNNLQGVNITEFGLTIDMGLISAKHYNKNLYLILMKFKKIDTDDSEAVARVLRELKDYLTT